jgi:hypothetical protein
VIARGVKDRETLVDLTARAGEAMFDPSRVAVGRGRDDEEAKTSALTVAMELYAVGRWDGRGRLIVHFPSSLRQQLRASPVTRFDRELGVSVHAGAFDLRPGVDYEVELPRELDPRKWRQLRLFD